MGQGSSSIAGRVAAAPQAKRGVPSPTPPLDSLPTKALQDILVHVETGSLLRAGQASTRLHAAAVPMLRTISISNARQPAVDSLMLYLRKHGHHVAHISVHGAGAAYRPRGDVQDRFAQKPCVVLTGLPPGTCPTVLSLENCCVQLTPNWKQADEERLGDVDSGNEAEAEAELAPWTAGRATGVLSAAHTGQLMQLRLASCLLLQPAASISEALGALTSLQQLELSYLSTEEPYNPAIFASPIRCLALPAGLSALTGLAHLTLGYLRLPPLATLQQLGRLTCLQHLTFKSHVTLAGGNPTPAAALLSPLAGITSLRYLRVGGTPPAATPHLAALTQLRDLHISRPTTITKPDLLPLTALQQLTRLVLPRTCLPNEWAEGAVHVLRSEPSDDTGHDVWLQLFRKLQTVAPPTT